MRWFSSATLQEVAEAAGYTGDPAGVEGLAGEADVEVGPDGRVSNEDADLLVSLIQRRQAQEAKGIADYEAWVAEEQPRRQLEALSRLSRLRAELFAAQREPDPNPVRVARLTSDVAEAQRAASGVTDLPSFEEWRLGQTVAGPPPAPKPVERVGTVARDVAAGVRVPRS
jgi:hypothetical protein